VPADRGQSSGPVRLAPAPDTAPPGARVERRRRGQAAAAAGAGTVVGLLIGVAFVEVVNPRQSAYRWGVIFALALIGLFAGGILAETRVAGDIDAPIRDLDAARRGESATAEQGQLPGSPVKPVITDDDPHTGNRE